MSAIKKDNLVVKANKLIEAKGRLSLLEQKIFASLVSEITPGQDSKTLYKININEIAELSNSKSSDIYNKLKKAAKNLLDKKILIEDDERSSFLAMTLFSSVEYKKNSGVLEIEISKKLKPYLLAINGSDTPFTKYQLSNILKLKSSYSIRIYELLKQYLKLHVRKFELEELKDYLGISEKYKVFSNFETYVLKVATKEINQNTDINIAYRKIKKGRKITHIEFEITQNEIDRELQNMESLYSKEEVESLKERLGLANKKINMKQISELIKIVLDRRMSSEINTDDYIQLNVLYVDRKNPENYFAYLKKALANDYCNAEQTIRIINRKNSKKKYDL